MVVNDGVVVVCLSSRDCGSIWTVWEVVVVVVLFWWGRSLFVEELVSLSWTSSP